MNRTQLQITNDAQVTMDLNALHTISGFVGSWVDRSGPLHASGAFFDFDKEKVYVRRIPHAEGIYAGVLTIPMEVEEVPPELNGITLLAPLHKILQVIKWTGRSETQSLATFKITTEGSVYMVGPDTTIQLNVEWFESVEAYTTPFQEYISSPMGVVETTYRKAARGDHDDKLKAHNQLSFDTKYGMSEWLREADLYRKDIEVGKVDSNIRYVDDKELPDHIAAGTYDEETGEVKTNSFKRTGFAVLGYSRMSLLFTPTEAEDMSSVVPLHGDDKSVPVSFLQDIVSFFKVAAGFVKNADAVLEIATWEEDVGDEHNLHLVSINLTNLTTEQTIVGVFTIPSAGAVGMAPPTTEDIEMIVPSVDERSLHIPLEFTHLKDTLEFWDSLQRVEGKDIVAPLKPVTLRAIGDNVLQLEMNSPDGTNEARFTTTGDALPPNLELKVPFDPLMKIINSPLMGNDINSDSMDTYITISRDSNIEEPSALVFQRNDTIAIVAEFV